MVSTHSKTPETYLTQYQTLLEKARKFNDTDLDSNKDPHEVFVRQEVQVVFSQATISLQANLRDDSVRASYEVETPNNLPNSSIAFRRQGDLLWVEESALPTLYDQGKQQNFTVNMQTQEIANETHAVLPTLAPKTEASQLMENDLSELGSMLQPNGWLVGSPWQKR